MWLRYSKYLIKYWVGPEKMARPILQKFEKIVLMGDSAGGHIVTMVALALRNPKLRNQYGDFKENINIDKLILSSPMYDYSHIVSIAKIALDKNGLMTLFSKN